ncbi:hypothetical protein GH714_013992 [Hevea brasiliensis]|uniref:Fungal lipase-like domain-containing protein n=1 Tax=Hevea brasiliensis TaxID=3981 RepID=A0A6A6LKH6_HEVBR|nr:hypothetical protein GH714_013992 [Hevea brasiliensis]
MSVTCGVECVVVLGCMRWAWKRCTYVGSDDSASWTLATKDEFEPVPRICSLILSVYETDTEHPQFSSPLDAKCLIKRVTYEQTHGRAPPYIIYLDHEHKEIVLAIRGEETLKDIWQKNGKECTMVFAGHSLGSGVAALLTIIAVNHRDQLGGIPRNKIRCYAVAPARCVSLNLAVKYADVINSIVLQDDFLPRTPTPLEDIFKSIFWFLALLAILVCLRDTFIPEGRKLRDPRRLYAPGRIYHIVERKFCRCGRFPPEVRTAIPVDGRFEHIVLSSNATSDHGIIWIKRESEKALQTMMESSSETTTTPPKVQKLDRLQTLEKEHQDAIERAVSLNIPHNESITEAEPQEGKEAESSHGEHEGEHASETKSQSSFSRTKWDELLNKVLEKDELDELAAKKDANAPK